LFWKNTITRGARNIKMKTEKYPNNLKVTRGHKELKEEVLKEVYKKLKKDFEGEQKYIKNVFSGFWIGEAIKLTLQERNTEVKKAINNKIEIRKGSLNRGVSNYEEIFSVNDLKSILKELRLEDEE